MKKNKILIGITLVVVLAAVVSFLALRSSKKVSSPSAPAVKVELSGHPMMGDKNAKIHIVAFEDLKCIACKWYNTHIFPIIKQKYIDTGKANYTVILLAFIDGSAPAANTAHCLYQQNPKYFFQFAKYVYANQPPEESNWATVATLLQFAKAAAPDADQTKLSQCMIEGRYNDLAVKNLKYATALSNKAKQKFVATPMIFVNGKLIRPLSQQTVEAAIK